MANIWKCLKFDLTFAANVIPEGQLNNKSILWYYATAISTDSFKVEIIDVIITGVSLHTKQ